MIRSWGPLLYHSSTADMLPPDIAHPPCCKDLYTIPGSWKKPSSCMAGSILTKHVTRWACLLLVSIYYSVFQFLPIFSNLTQPLKRDGPTFYRPQSTTWSTLCVVVLNWVRQMVARPDSGWFSDSPCKTAHFREAFYHGQANHWFTVGAELMRSVWLLHGIHGIESEHSHRLRSVPAVDAELSHPFRSLLFLLDAIFLN